MGLSGPRKRSKISHDPNNTSWSRCSTKYGQRILQAHGWKPGDQLGASHTSYASSQTVVSVSHFKSALKDDTLGLGARRGGKDGEPATGLNEFQDILGRLNGKGGSEIEKEQSVRRELQKDRYLERWGTLRFVSGGHLVGDRLVTLSGQGRKISADVKDSVRAEMKKSCHSTTTSAKQDVEATGLTKAKRRLEKAERKLQRQRRREESAATQNQGRVSVQGTKREDPADGLPEDCSNGELKVLEAQAIPQAVSPAQHIRSRGGGRHAIRQRYTQHKKMAMMDTKALNEIFMTIVPLTPRSPVISSDLFHDGLIIMGIYGNEITAFGCQLHG
ncbi:MAG: hypothetical protein Q9217_000314 [Psora testacea]